MCKNRMRVAGVGLNASSCAHVRPCAMCPCNCRLATCNVRCTWRGTVWESPPDACLHICSGKVLGLLMTRWPTWWCHGLNRNWGIHSQPNEPKSQSAFTCSWVWVPFQSGTKLALLSPGFVCLFVALSEIAFKLLWIKSKCLRFLIDFVLLCHFPFPPSMCIILLLWMKLLGKCAKYIEVITGWVDCSQLNQVFVVIMQAQRTNAAFK